MRVTRVGEASKPIAGDCRDRRRRARFNASLLLENELCVCAGLLCW